MLPDKLLVNLKILSKVPKMGRLSRSVDGIISLESESFYLPVKRYLSSDSRKQTMYEINNIVNDAIQLLENIYESKYMHQNHCKSEEYKKNCDLLELVNNSLQSSVVGLENLKVTYQDDPNIVSQIDIVILKIQTCNKEVLSKLHDYKKYLNENKIENKPNTKKD